MKTNDVVITPNGKGVFQFRLWSEGQELAAVSHKPDAELDFTKCVGHMGDGKGVWVLCAYLIGEVANAH